MKLHWAILLALATAITAVAWPAGAGRIALVLVAIVAGSLAVPALVGLAKQFPRQPVVDRFRDEGPSRITPDKPGQLQILERALEASSGTQVVSYPIREQLRVSARRRLLDRQRLDIDRRADHVAISRVVSTDLWSVLAPSSDEAGRPRPARPIPSALLPTLITEIEQL